VFIKVKGVRLKRAVKIYAFCKLLWQQKSKMLLQTGGEVFAPGSSKMSRLGFYRGEE
jgi:hypothetical protein